MPDPDDDRLSMPLLPQHRTPKEDQVEIRRLTDEVYRLTRERDAYRAAVDGHVRSIQWQTPAGEWRSRECHVGYYPTRDEAEAAYRVANGFDFSSARTEAPADAPAE